MPKKKKKVYIITLDHIEAAARWAQKAYKAKRAIPLPNSRIKRVFLMDTYACGTQCCIAGAAAMIAGASPAQAHDIGGDLHWLLGVSAIVRHTRRGRGLVGIPFADHIDTDTIHNAMTSDVPESEAPALVLKACKAARRELAALSKNPQNA